MRPFKGGSLSELFSKRVYEVIQEIERLSNEQALADQNALETRYIDQVRIEPLVLRDNEKEMVRGTLDIVIPFEGYKRLWEFQPSRFTLSDFPDIRILDDRIVFSLGDPRQVTESKVLKETLNEAVNSLVKAVSELKPDIEKYNVDAVGKVKLALKNRRERALQNIAAINSLGLPVRDKA